MTTLLEGAQPNNSCDDEKASSSNVFFSMCWQKSPQAKTVSHKTDEITSQKQKSDSAFCLP